MRSCNSNPRPSTRYRGPPPWQHHCRIERLEERLPLNSAWQNPGQEKDANNDSFFTPYDVRTVLADALTNGPRSLVGEPVIPWSRIDIDGDEWCTSADIRDIYNALLMQYPVFAPQLANDTGHDPMDRVTQDPTLHVGASSLGDEQVLLTIQGSTAAPVDITAGFVDAMQTITPELLAEANGGPLEDGAYTVVIYAEKDGEIVPCTVVDLTFRLDTTPVPPATLDLAVGSDTGDLGDHETEYAVVDFTGLAPEGHTVHLMTASGDPLQTVQPDAVGAFGFRDVSLDPGENDFTACVVDEASNSTESLHTFVRTESASELLPLDAALALFETDASLDDVALDELAAELEVR